MQLQGAARDGHRPEGDRQRAQEVARPDLRRRRSRRRCEGAEVVLLLTEWPEYVALDPTSSAGSSRRRGSSTAATASTRPPGAAPAGPTARSAAVAVALTAGAPRRAGRSRSAPHPTTATGSRVVSAPRPLGPDDRGAGDDQRVVAGGGRSRRQQPGTAAPRRRRQSSTVSPTAPTVRSPAPETTSATPARSAGGEAAHGQAVAVVPGLGEPVQVPRRHGHPRRWPRPTRPALSADWPLARSSRTTWDRSRASETLPSSPTCTLSRALRVAGESAAASTCDLTTAAAGRSRARRGSGAPGAGRPGPGRGRAARRPGSGRAAAGRRRSSSARRCRRGTRGRRARPETKRRTAP